MIDDRLPPSFYEDEYVTIFHNRCEDVLPYLPDQSFGVVLTDPPYEKEAHAGNRRVKANKIVAEGLPFGAMDEELRRYFIEQARRLCTGWLVTFCQIEAVGIYQQVLGAAYRRPMIWYKPDGAPQLSGDRPAIGFEAMVAAWFGEAKSEWNAGGKNGVYRFNCSDFQHDHPTQKPEPLMHALVKDFTIDSSTYVLDPFMGGGTTLAACKKLGIRCVGIEMREDYAELSATRVAGIVPDNSPFKWRPKREKIVSQLGLGEAWR